jgi:hypothetical protein
MKRKQCTGCNYIYPLPLTPFPQGQELIDDQFLASSGRPTDSGFAQPEVLANLCCRQAQISNRPVSQNTKGRTLPHFYRLPAGKSLSFFAV